MARLKAKRQLQPRRRERRFVRTEKVEDDQMALFCNSF
jgi:hypothetical protein